MADKTYKTDGSILNQTSNWGRYCRVRLYAHTAPVAGTDTSTYNQNFSQAMTGDVVLDVSDLRVVFEIKRFAMYYPNSALISIYNLTADMENTIIYEGYRITVDAGYADNYGQIFDGWVLQCTRWKENGTDFVLQILALDGNPFINDGYCSFTYAKGMTARDVVTKIAADASNPVPVAYLSPKLEELKLSKGIAVHGLSRNTLSDIAKSINGTWFIDCGQLYMVSYADDVSKLPMGMQAIELNERTGLLGNPKQNQQGVNVLALLNPQFMPYGFVHISNSLITAQLVTLGTLGTPPSHPWALDVSGLYRIVSVVFRGDTRGANEGWVADLVTISQTGSIPEMFRSTNATAN